MLDCLVRVMFKLLFREWIWSSTLFGSFLLSPPPPIVRLRSQANADWQNPAGALIRTQMVVPGTFEQNPAPSFLVRLAVHRHRWSFLVLLLLLGSTVYHIENKVRPLWATSFMQHLIEIEETGPLVSPSALISSQGLVGPWCNRNRRVTQSMTWYNLKRLDPPMKWMCFISGKCAVLLFMSMLMQCYELCSSCMW